MCLALLDKCVSLSVCGSVGVRVPTKAKGIKSPLELEIQLAISRPIQVLEIILRFSARAIHTLTHGAMSPALIWRFKGTHRFSSPWGFPQWSILYSKLDTGRQCVFPERNLVTHRECREVESMRNIILAIFWLSASPHRVSHNSKGTSTTVCASRGAACAGPTQRLSLGWRKLCQSP